MVRDPISNLNARVTDVNLQIIELQRYIQKLEARLENVEESAGDPEGESSGQVTCRRLQVVDPKGVERIVLEVDDENNATISFQDAHGIMRLLAGAFADGEAYTHWADAAGGAVITARCTAAGKGTLDAASQP